MFVCKISIIIILICQKFGLAQPVQQKVKLLSSNDEICLTWRVCVSKPNKCQGVNNEVIYDYTSLGSQKKPQNKTNTKKSRVTLGGNSTIFLLVEYWYAVKP